MSKKGSCQVLKLSRNLASYLLSFPGVRLDRSRIILFLGERVTLCSGAKRPCFAAHSKYRFSPTIPSFCKIIPELGDSKLGFYLCDAWIICQ